MVCFLLLLLALVPATCGPEEIHSPQARILEEPDAAPATPGTLLTPSRSPTPTRSAQGEKPEQPGRPTGKRENPHSGASKPHLGTLVPHKFSFSGRKPRPLEGNGQAFIESLTESSVFSDRLYHEDRKCRDPGLVGRTMAGVRPKPLRLLPTAPQRTGC